MIPPVDTRSDRHSGVLLAFWIACGLAIAGGLAPLAFGGTSNRIAGVIVPFGVAALAFALNALIHHHGRVLPTLLYFVGGIGIVYGILWMITVPLQLAVVGTCPPPPESCQPGQLPSLTSGEANGLTAGVGLGLLAIALGFIGLALLYRRKATPAIKPVATPPAARSRPPMTAKASAEVAEEAPDAKLTPAAAAVAKAEAVAEPEHADAPLEAREAPPELPAPEEPLELPAPEPALELPAPAAATEPTASTSPEPPPAPAHKPRVRRPRKPPPATSADEATEPPPAV
jgi:hypothetical protein